MSRAAVALCAALAAALAWTLHAAPAAGDAATAPADHGYAVAPVPGTVTRGFDPPATRYGAGHRGVDVAATAGDPVVAAMGGTVTFSGRVALVGWVTIDHGGGLRTTYGPLSPRVVSAGERVAQGALVGFLAKGSDHLDWGARLDGSYIDPLTLLARWETYLTTPDDAGAPPLGGFVGPAATTADRRLRWPLRAMVTSEFGPRMHPVTGERRHHAGIDIAATTGTPVMAAGGGTVAFAGTVSGYGLTVVVDHGGGSSTLYGHLSAIAVVAGASVAAGQRIGSVGATGTATGPHLHFEVRRGGIAHNPRSVLPG